MNSEFNSDTDISYRLKILKGWRDGSKQCGQWAIGVNGSVSWARCLAINKAMKWIEMSWYVCIHVFIYMCIFILYILLLHI